MPLLLRRWWLCLAKLLGCLLLLTGCRQHPTEVGPLIEGLRESSQLLAQANEYACLQIAGQAYRNYANAKYDLWLPRAQAVRKEAEQLTAWLHQLEQHAQSLEGDMRTGWLEKLSDSIYQQVVQYRDTVMKAFDTSRLMGYPDFCRRVTQERESRSRQFAQRFNFPARDSLPKSVPQYLRSFSSTVEPAQVLVLLEAAVNRTAYDITNYCLSQVSVMEGDYQRVSMIATASSSVVKAGQTIEVTAGIGEFGLSRKPVISINSVVRNTGEEGVAKYAILAAGKPGKRQIPVSASFEKPDGTRDTVFKTIEYIIVP